MRTLSSSPSFVNAWNIAHHLYSGERKVVLHRFFASQNRMLYTADGSSFGVLLYVSVYLCFGRSRGQLGSGLMAQTLVRKLQLFQMNIAFISVRSHNRAFRARCLLVSRRRIIYTYLAHCTTRVQEPEEVHRTQTRLSHTCLGNLGALSPPSVRRSLMTRTSGRNSTARCSQIVSSPSAACLRSQPSTPVGSSVPTGHRQNQDRL